MKKPTAVEGWKFMDISQNEMVRDPETLKNEPTGKKVYRAISDGAIVFEIEGPVWFKVPDSRETAQTYLEGHRDGLVGSAVKAAKHDAEGIRQNARDGGVAGKDPAVLETELREALLGNRPTRKTKAVVVSGESLQAAIDAGTVDEYLKAQGVTMI